MQEQDGRNGEERKGAGSTYNHIPCPLSFSFVCSDKEAIFACYSCLSSFNQGKENGERGEEGEGTRGRKQKAIMGKRQKPEGCQWRT